NAVILIELSGGGATNGLTIAASAPYVTGIAINGFPGSGIEVVAGLGTIGLQLSGVFIGTDASGSIARPNGIGVHTTPGSTGLAVCDSSVGGRTLISGNLSFGVNLESGDLTRICNTYVGTNAAGNAALGNGNHGVQMNGTTNTHVLDNVISGN